MHCDLEICITHVVPDDVLMLLAVLRQAGAAGASVNCEFRVINELDGLRWFRIASLPQAASSEGIQTGVLVDITLSKHVAMRERLSFESTQFLAGTRTLEDAVTWVIQLVCEGLGWEWRAYWALDQSPMNEAALVCKHYWHVRERTFTALTRESRSIRMAPGEGLVGHVWNAGQPSWVEDFATDANFLRRLSARECGLRSGYAFPVSHVSLDNFGMEHSSLSRLKRLPTSSLKIDRSFVRGLPQDRGDCAIVRTILDLGRHMELLVIAEGVETDAQLAFLRQFGCMLIQGYILGKPKPLADLLALEGW